MHYVFRQELFRYVFDVFKVKYKTVFHFCFLRFSDSAARILAVLDRFRPNQASVASAKAVALMSAQRFDEAAEYIDKEALVRFPGNPMLLAFKGLALIRLGDREGSRMPLEEAASQKEDAAARQLAVDMLGDL